MKIKDYKCKCGSDDFFFTDKGNQKGIYCCKCGKWLKWADKGERNLEQQQDDKRMQEEEWDEVYKNEDITPSVSVEEVEKSFIKDVEAVKDLLPCEDAISRQVISDYVESHIQEINTGYGDLNAHTNKILRMIVDYINNMPSVSPARPTGKWIWIKEAESVNTYSLVCSCCNNSIYKIGNVNNIEEAKKAIDNIMKERDWKYDNFCVNCGSYNRR